ncbi:MAG TPA: hypothetical protein VFR43_08250 [Gaiellaceae bacterium]|nr:hypothetical protein [Gaiellaceae bacterium]
MTTSNPTRLLLVVAGLAVAALALVFVVRPLVLGDDEATSTPAPATKPVASKPVHSTPARSGAVHLVAGVPAPVAQKLQTSKVVVVSLFTPRAEYDRRVMAHARAGAKTSGAAFVAINVRTEKKARQLATFFEAAPSPSVIVVRRPGKVVTQFNGFADSALVAQAAQNAGAKKKQPKS